jgi:hypothetical protein
MLMKILLQNNLLRNKMKKLILFTIISLFLFGSCGVTKKKCDGTNKIKTDMW